MGRARRQAASELHANGAATSPQLSYPHTSSPILQRASNTAELVFDNVRVPAATHLVGAEGDAVLCMMRNLEIERLALAGMSLGIARRCIEAMNSYARERKAFGQPINRFGQIQHHIATSYAEYAAARAYVYNTARGLDLSSAGSRLDSDGVKLFASVMATNVANRAIQTCVPAGAAGYRRRREYLLPSPQRVQPSHAACSLARLPPSSHPPLRPRARPQAGRQRLHWRVRRGAAVAGRQAARDWRRHGRGAREEHDARHGQDGPPELMREQPST